ncbi:unnamed protein product [Microthlaspi erraticum]|uniref:Uncharacterized protein n=1 Tax=Microthlaspi erraticum TaxID=1685480 RepID=A0A6D2HID5_9BRAS|nr:unnamed protein product [Microthlaspi erraticum]
MMRKKVCFEPSEVISQPLPTNSNWVHSELAGLGDKDTVPAAVKEASGSSTSASSETHSLSHKVTVPEPTNGSSRSPYSQHRGKTEERAIENNNHRELWCSLTKICSLQDLQKKLICLQGSKTDEENSGIADGEDIEHHRKS